jgi:insertion element IS1 protein InsB
MEQFIQIKCRHCQSEDLVKNGRSENGTQRYRCNTCKGSFQLDYTYNAWKEGVKEQIDSQTLNSSGVRDIARNLKIAKRTVTQHLKKKAPLSVNPYYIDKLESQQLSELDVDIRFEVEGDEFWSYVGNKKNQRWTWYAVDRSNGVILAYHQGKRTDESCKALMGKLAQFPIRCFYTDDWQSYKKFIPEEKHRIGKDRTWKIERKNLNFRTHIKRLNRKTICFSKNETIHDNVIGMYINHYYFKTGLFGNTG